MTITTKTNIRTEYAGLGLTKNGTWRKITASRNTPEEANEQLQEYIADVTERPDLYISFEEYKVMKRTVITATEDWN